MSEETPESLIPYDEIVQEALRDVVGRVLGEVERSGGLPGGHHFYITFKTRLPGVSIPKHLMERFPDFALRHLTRRVEACAQLEARTQHALPEPLGRWPLLHSVH